MITRKIKSTLYSRRRPIPEAPWPRRRLAQYMSDGAHVTMWTTGEAKYFIRIDDGTERIRWYKLEENRMGKRILTTPIEPGKIHTFEVPPETDVLGLDTEVSGQVMRLVVLLLADGEGMSDKENLVKRHFAILSRTCTLPDSVRIHGRCAIMQQTSLLTPDNAPQVPDSHLCVLAEAPTVEDLQQAAITSKVGMPTEDPPQSGGPNTGESPLKVH